MTINVQSAIGGFAVGLALAAATAQAMQPDQRHPQATANVPTAPVAPSMPKGRMMGDPVKHHEMMKQMAQCRDMMSHMMEHMRHEGHRPTQPPAPPKQ